MSHYSHYQKNHTKNCHSAPSNFINSLNSRLHLFPGSLEALCLFYEEITCIDRWVQFQSVSKHTKKKRKICDEVVREKLCGRSIIVYSEPSMTFLKFLQLSSDKKHAFRTCFLSSSMYLHTIHFSKSILRVYKYIQAYIIHIISQTISTIILHHLKHSKPSPSSSSSSSRNSLACTKPNQMKPTSSSKAFSLLLLVKEKYLVDSYHVFCEFFFVIDANKKKLQLTRRHYHTKQLAESAYAEIPPSFNS